MSYYKTEEQRQKDKEDEFKALMLFLGNEVVFEKRIMFRETPHSNSIFIDKVNINDDFKSYGLAQDTILQKLRGMKFDKLN